MVGFVGSGGKAVSLAGVYLYSEWGASVRVARVSAVRLGRWWVSVGVPGVWVVRECEWCVGVRGA